VDDLCGLVARKAGWLREFAGREGELRIVACYPRAVRWLFAMAGAKLPEQAQIFNLRTESPAKILTGLASGAGSVFAKWQGTARPAPGEAKLTSGEDGWRPWFPVIDFDRCNNCMQCLSFCLFSVYGVDSARMISVANPENCKTNCPACSRVCPEAAIIFPKYASRPINGAEISPSDLERESMKADISALLGGDVYGALRERSKTTGPRFSPERDPETALRERRRHLAALAELGQVPAEVLKSLPPADELRRRAMKAKEQAEAAVAAADRNDNRGGNEP